MSIWIRGGLLELTSFAKWAAPKSARLAKVWADGAYAGQLID